jgi:hypothetical protein
MDGHKIWVDYWEEVKLEGGAWLGEWVAGSLTLKGIPQPWPFPRMPFCFLVLKVSRSAPPYLCAVIYYGVLWYYEVPWSPMMSPQAKEQWSQSTMEQNLWNCETK